MRYGMTDDMMMTMHRSITSQMIPILVVMSTSAEELAMKRAKNRLNYYYRVRRDPLLYSITGVPYMLSLCQQQEREHSLRGHRADGAEEGEYDGAHHQYDWIP